MNKKRFIKVTPQGEDKFIVLTAQNANFYLNQGAKVEQPTEEEILQFFPEMAETHTQSREQQLETELKKANEIIESLKAEIEKLKTKKRKKQ